MGHILSNMTFDHSKNKAVSIVSVGKNSKSNTTKVVLNLKKRDKDELNRVKNSAYSYLTL